MLQRPRKGLMKRKNAYSLYRRVVMTWKRLRYGLHAVAPTFFMAGKSYVSRDLVAGEYSFIGGHCVIGPGVHLGRYVMCASAVQFVGDDHRADLPGVPMIFAGRPLRRQIHVEDDVWIGANAVIMAGVRIGRGAIVAAGAVITKNVPPYEIHGGIPARRIGVRFQTDAERAIHDAMLQGPIVRGSFAAEFVLKTEPELATNTGSAGQ